MTAALEGGERSAAYPGRTLPPGKNPVPILQEDGWAPGPVWMVRKSRSHRDLIPDRPAHSQSLYRLSYPAHTDVNTLRKFVLTINLAENSDMLHLYSWQDFYKVIFKTKQIMYSFRVSCPPVKNSGCMPANTR